MQDTLFMREIVGFVERKLVNRSKWLLSLINILLLCIVSIVSEKQNVKYGKDNRADEYQETARG